MTDELRKTRRSSLLVFEHCYQRARPSRDMLNVSTADPRRTVTVMFANPNPRPRGSYTMESRLVAREIPNATPSGRRRMTPPRLRTSMMPVVASMATATGYRRAMASWRATENAAPSSPIAPRTAIVSRTWMKRGIASAKTTPAIVVTSVSSSNVNPRRIGTWSYATSGVASSFGG